MSLFFKFRTGKSGGGGSGRSSGGGAVVAAGGAAGGGACGMEVAVAARSPHKPALHVNFSDKGEVKERREKFLTAKYGAHQMALIRKRLAVEMWLYDELHCLYHPEAKKGDSSSAVSSGDEVEVDIDELLDMDSEPQRRDHLARLLVDAKRPQKDVNKFINDLLEKAKTL